MPEQLKETVVEETKFEIVEPVVAEKKEITTEDLVDFSEAEKEMAEKQGILSGEKKDDVSGEVPTTGDVKDKKDIEDKKSVEEKNDQTFEDTEKNEKALIKNYNKNEQALYFKWKSDKSLRQQAQREHELAIIKAKSLEKELEKIKTDTTISSTKLKKINDLLTGNAEDITVEAIQEILAQGVTKKEDDDNKPVTKKDLIEIEEKKKQEEVEIKQRQDFFTSRVNEVEEFGKTNYENFDEIVKSAQDVLNGNVELPDYIDAKELSTKLVEKLTNKEVDAQSISKFVVSIAKLNSNFGKEKSEGTKKEVRKETNENIDRILKNASKPASATAMNGGNGRRMVSESDLTIDDVAKMSSSDYSKLKPETRRRLLAEAS